MTSNFSHRVAFIKNNLLGFAVGLAGFTGLLSLAAGQAAAAAPNCTVGSGAGFDYATIQAAVDDTGCTAITVNPGTYTENVTVNRAVTLTATGTDAVISGQVTLTADGAGVEGFTIMNPSGDYGVVIPHVSNVTVSGNTINNIGTSVTNTNVYGVWYQGSTAAGTASNITISNNTFSNIGSASNAHSDGAILVGDSASHENITSGLVISGNTVSSVLSSTKGAYGIEVNLGSAADTASVTGASISGNDISGLSGGWKTAIGLEADTPSASLSGNTVQGSVTAVNFESNPSASTVSMSGNTLNGSGLSNSTSTVGVDGAWSVLAPGANTYPEVSVGGQYYYYGLNAFSTIAQGITAASSGATVNVAAGTYNENVVVDKDITLSGAGSDASGTVIQPSSGNGITVSASGASAGSPLTIENLRVTGATDGVYFNSAVSHVALSNVALVDNTTYGIEIHNSAVLNDLNLSTVSVSGSVVGFRVATTGSVDGLTVTDSHFDNNSGQGFYIAANSGSTTNQNDFTNISITNTSFSNDAGKGFYAEKLNNATFNGITVDNSGTSGSFGSGFNINEKYGSYQNITIEGHSSFTNSGTGDATNGTGINIEARNDGSYASNPATLSGVTISNSTITGNQVGIRFGETGKNNSGPTGVTLRSNDLSGNINGSVNNQSLATTDAAKNWWGSASNPSALVSGDVTYSPWCTDASCVSYTSDEAVVLATSGNQATTSGDTTLSGSPSGGSVSAVIPDGTTVTATGVGTWDGTISPPTASAYTVPGSNATGVAIQVGSSGFSLTFDKGVRLLFPGQAGKHVGFVASDGTFTEITSVCADDTQAVGNALAGGACKIDLGNGNLVVWTQHFTTFATYSPVSGGMGGGSSSSSTTTSATTTSSKPKTVFVTTSASAPAGGEEVAAASTATPATTPNETGTSTNGNSTANKKPSSKRFLGLGWWWLPIVAVVLALLYGLGRFVNGNSKKA